MGKHIGTLVFTGSMKGYNRVEKFGRLNITSTVEQAGFSLLVKHPTFNLTELCEAIETDLRKFADSYHVTLSISRQQIKSAVSRLACFERFDLDNYKKAQPVRVAW